MENINVTPHGQCPACTTPDQAGLPHYRGTEQHPYKYPCVVSEARTCAVDRLKYEAGNGSCPCHQPRPVQPGPETQPAAPIQPQVAPPVEEAAPNTAELPSNPRPEPEVKKEEPPKDLGGRPSLYREEYCNKVVEHMTYGFSLESFAGVTGVNRDTVYQWQKDHPEFKHAVEVGFAKCQFYWEKVGISGTIGIPTELTDSKGKKIVANKFNALSWKFNMQNRFGWKERTDMTSDDKQIDGPVIYKPEKKPEMAR